MNKSILIAVVFCCLILPASTMADSISAEWLGSPLAAIEGGVDSFSFWNGSTDYYESLADWNVEVNPVSILAQYDNIGTTVTEAIDTVTEVWTTAIFTMPSPNNDTIVAVPEPSVLVLLGTCLAVFVGVRNRRKIQ
jgi:hypothetical protein